MKPDNIIFVKHGDKYSAEHVNRLWDKLKEFYPMTQYFCYTEDPIGVEIETIPCFKKPSLRFWWNKLAMFSADFPVKGKCLFFDLDMDVKEPTDFALGLLYDRVVPGGIIVFDDYNAVAGETISVDEFVAKHKLKLEKLPFYNVPAYVRKPI